MSRKGTMKHWYSMKCRKCGWESEPYRYKGQFMFEWVMHKKTCYRKESDDDLQEEVPLGF